MNISRYTYAAAFAIFALWAAPLQAGVEELLASGKPVKCGTPYILAGEAGTPKTAASYRTSGMQHNVLTSGGHFRVHYNATRFIDNVDATDLSGNGIPDYVDSCMVYLEYAYGLLIGPDGAGFDPPLPDGTLGGGPEIDIYLKNLSGVYGLTTPSNQSGSASSAYIEIDNDFAESIYATHGLEALKVTTAHEFFHAVQFRLSNNFAFNWWMEHSSVWMEEYAWGEVNDYLAYLRFFFDNREYPLDTRNGSFEYGAAIWAMYLAKVHGPEIIHDIWVHNTLAGSNSIADFDAVIPGGLAAALGEFAVWNYFTGTRGNGADFYPDSPSFSRMIETDQSANKSPATGSLSAKRLTSRYVELLFAGEWSAEDYLQVSVTPLDTGTYTSLLVLYNSPMEYRVQPLDGLPASIPLEGVWQRGVLVTACDNTTGTGDYSYTFETEVIDMPAEPEPTAFALHSPYPNPFNPATTVALTIPGSGGNVSVAAYSATGQKVADIFSGWLGAGDKEIIWRPDGLATGVYFIKIDAPWGTKTAKTLYLR